MVAISIITISKDWSSANDVQKGWRWLSNLDTGYVVSKCIHHQVFMNVGVAGSSTEPCMQEFLLLLFLTQLKDLFFFWLAHLSPSWIGADVSLSSAGACGFRSLSSCGGSHCGECYRWRDRLLFHGFWDNFHRRRRFPQVVSFLRSPLMRMPPSCNFISPVWFKEQLQLVGMIVCL